MKSYDIIKTYFKIKIGRWTWQLRKLNMTSIPSGLTTVFTISSDVKESSEPVANQ